MALERFDSADVPQSDVCVKVSVIDSTLTLEGIACSYIWQPAIKGFDRFKAGCWCFLIEHPSGRKLVYDLGTRKDWQKLPPALRIKEYLDDGILQELRVEKGVADILVEGGVDLNEIEGVIWSHFHFDHTGDPDTFPKSTRLVVGGGTKENYMPGYPADPEARILESDYAGREVFEVDFSDVELEIGGLKAFDYFGDGSFYILEAPGHTIGHIAGFARTSSGDSSSFIHMAGDECHHGAEIRPTKHLPLPDSIEPSPLPRLHPTTCPAHIFNPILRDGSKTEHILEWSPPNGHNEEPKYALTYDEPALRETIRKAEAMDGSDAVFTIMAHDWSLKGVIDEWPKTLNSWKEKSWKDSTRWKFLEDFEGAIQSSS